MDTNNLRSILNQIALLPQAFTFREVQVMLQELIEDQRFIILHKSGNENHFISDRALFQWFVEFSVGQAKVNEMRLDSHRLAATMTSLHADEIWDTPPNEAIKYGSSYGFVCQAYTSGYYVFPLAYILSLLPNTQLQASTKVLGDMCDKEKRIKVLSRSQEDWINEGLDDFRTRDVFVVKSREGLLGSRRTLEEIGNELGITRERVRQIESKFWKRMQHHPNRAIFAKALICSIMRKQGSLVFHAYSDEGVVLRFVAKCAGVLHAIVPQTTLAVISACPENIAASGFPVKFPRDITAEGIAAHIESERQPCLSGADLRVICEQIANRREQRLNRMQRVYLAIREIGKPAHYSEVAEVHNSLFPEHISTEHNIHAVLERAQHGVVWIGVRGTYALKEWGYERPKMGLYEAVTEIVKKKFDETSEPVPITVIFAEIGKYRRSFTESGLKMAISLNANLRRVSKDSFIPIENAEPSSDYDTYDEKLDLLLQEFEKRKGSAM